MFGLIMKSDNVDHDDDDAHDAMVMVIVMVIIMVMTIMNDNNHDHDDDDKPFPKKQFPAKSNSIPRMISLFFPVKSQRTT